MDTFIRDYELQRYDYLFFDKNGFWLSPVLINEAGLEIVRNHAESVMNQEFSTGIEPYQFKKQRGGKQTYKLTNVYMADSVLSRLILNEKIAKVAAQLIRKSRIRFWRDHLWKKPTESKSAGNVGWHQDYLYWQSAWPAELITAWIALDDCTINNGCLHYVPGSHKWGLLNTGDLYSADMLKNENSYRELTGKNFTPVPCEMKAGSVVFHHCLTVHGSFANNTSRPRRSISVHYMPEGTVFKSNKGIKPFSNERLFGGEDGQAYSGPYFPILYSRNEKLNPWK